jgi:hypothetical protein
MTKEEIIRIGTLLGLQFEEKTNYRDFLEKEIVVFDGCNGQRFLFDSQWTDDEIYEKLGSSLILMGKRMKALEIHRVLSITSDYE